MSIKQHAIQSVRINAMNIECGCDFIVICIIESFARHSILIGNLQFLYSIDKYVLENIIIAAAAAAVWISQEH